jgi:hypothetical protein
MRTFVTVALLGATALLGPATAASAATPLRASIICDAVTGTITTAASGNLLLPGSPKPVTVEFQRRSNAVNISLTGTTYTSPLAKPVTVTVQSTSAGDVSATGYTGSFTPATSLYYRETVAVTFKNAAGRVYTTAEATCERDLRTTVTLTCDPTAGTVTAAALGRNGQAGSVDGSGRPTSVGYRFSPIQQSGPLDPRFQGHVLGNAWDIKHRITQAADGTWTDTGYVRAITTNPYYYAEELTVGVFNSFGVLIGGGFAKCTLFDGSVKPVPVTPSGSATA